MQVEATILGNLMLAFFNLSIIKFLNPAALQADKMIMVAAFVEFKNGAPTLKMMALEQAGLFKLRQHTVNRRQPDVGILVKQQFIDVFRRHMSFFRCLKQFKHLQARKRCL